MTRFLPYLLLALAVLSPPICAQGNPELSLRYLSATSYNDPASGKNYAYLVWQSQDPKHLRKLDLSLFSKSGARNSPASFIRRGSMSFQSNTAILSALLDSTPDTLVEPVLLEERIDSLFGSLLPAENLSLAMKISGVLQIAATDAEVYRRLLFFSRTHPFIGIAMGTAASFALNDNVTTFEARSSNGDAATVEGRVTLDLAHPPLIRKPGPAVHVIDQAASGHLNTKLRWGIPAPLARMTALTYGFNVYRISRDFSETRDFHNNSPTPAEISALLTSAPDQISLVNRVPILPIAILSLAEAADISADPDTAFITDDNGVILDGGSPLNDGDQFYYFIAARDLLGRPGQLSDATLVTFCDRQRPEAPRRVEVKHAHEYGSSPSDFLQVSWEAPREGDTPDFYYVYRWDNPEQMLAAAFPFDPIAHRISGPIAHNPSIRRYQFNDTGSGAPALTPGSYRAAGDDGKTYWYSVRAVENTACGPLSSPNSSPAWGVLRDRFGPLAAGASLTVTRICPEITKGDFSTRSLTDGEQRLYSGSLHFDHFVHLSITRIDPRIDAVQVYFCGTQQNAIGEATQTFPIDGKRYTEGDETLDVRFRLPASAFSSENYGILICARDINSKTTYLKFPFAAAPNPDNGGVSSLPFFVDITENSNTISGGGIDGGEIHSSVDPSSGELQPTLIAADPPDDAREYKLYKRIDSGNLLLVEQGEVIDPEIDIAIEDYALPANAATVCYFLQWFDEHGNPSPMTDLGCVQTTTKVAMPVPILSQAEKAGDEASPKTILRWFCETEGVERFRISIHDGETNIPINYSNELHTAIISVSEIPSGAGPPGKIILSDPGAPSFGGSAIGFSRFLTGRVGGNFGDPQKPNEFQLTLNLASGREYQFYIESVSAANDSSLPSNTVTFRWSPAAEVIGPVVPWPARSLPARDPDFIPGIKAQYAENTREDRHYAVIKIGEVSAGASQPDISQSYSDAEAGEPFRVNPGYNSNKDSLDLFTSNGGESAFPFVLYRHQVSNEYFPEVSGDIIQVSPLVTRIRTGPHPEGGSLLSIHDPFIELLPDPDDPDIIGIYLKDTQGVVRGSTYTYVLLRFKNNGEIDRAIPSNNLFIPFVDPSTAP